MFSMMQTAIENGLHPYKYLTWLLKDANNINLTDSGIVRTTTFLECTIRVKTCK